MQQRNLRELSAGQLFRLEEQGELSTSRVASELRRRRAESQRPPPTAPRRSARSVRFVETEEREPGTGRRALRREVRTEAADPEIEPGTGRVSVPEGRGFGVEAGTGRVSPTEARQQARASLERARREAVRVPSESTLESQQGSDNIRRAQRAAAITEIKRRTGAQAGDRVTVGSALRSGVRPETIAQAGVATQEQVTQVQRALRAEERLKDASVGELTQALQEGGVKASRLIELGADRARVRAAQVRATALKRLEEFKGSEPGQFKLAQALRARTPVKVLQNAGFSKEQIDLAKEYNKSIERIAALAPGKPKSETARKVQDVLNEAFTLTGRETETFNKNDLEKEYDRRAQELNRVYNEKLIELSEEGKGRRPVTTREQFVKQNLGTKEGYVNTILEQQDNLKALAQKGKDVGRFAKEAGLASIPIYGTIRTWDEDPNWARAVGIATDLTFFIPIVGQVSAGVRGGKGLRAITKETTISSIRAETVGQIEAIAHPIQTVKATARPAADFLNPSRVPTSSITFRDSTIRIPAEQEFTSKYGGHASYPFAIKIPEGSVEGLGVATVARPGAPKGATFPTNEAAREFLKGRDVATMRLVRGESGNAFVGTDAQGKRISVNIPKAPFSKSVGAAAFHGTPDLRPFLPGFSARGKEGGMFIAPTALTRFIRASAAGKTADLDPAIQKAIQRLPDKSKNALGIGRVADKPIPGALVIRDPEVLKTLQGSNKFWQGTGEIELVIPEGTKVPAPSQFIKSRNEAGETIYLAVVGKPLSKAEIAKLKFVGAKETIGTIFSKPGTAMADAFGTADRRTARLMAQSTEEARRADDLFVQASDARKAGDIERSDELLGRAEDMANRSASSYTRAQVRAGETFSRAVVEPGVVYTGRQDIEKALTESELGRRPTEQQIQQNRRRNTLEAALTEPRRRAPGAPREDGRRGDTERPAAEDGRRPPSERPPEGERRTGPERRREDGVRPPGPPRRFPPPPRPPGPPRGDEGGRTPEPPRGDRPARPDGGRGDRPPDGDRARLRKFDLPGDAEKALKRGEFPRVVTWRQGLFNVTVDIDRGTRTFEKAPGTGKGVSPRETFRVLSKDRSRPTAKTFRQGIVNLNVTPRNVSFSRAKRM